MALTHKEAEAIRDWIPSPFSSFPDAPSPTREKFLCRWLGSPTPSDSSSEAVWTRAGLSYLCNDDLADVAGTVLLSHIPHAICRKPASLEIIKGLVRKLFDYGLPLKMLVFAGEALSLLPRTEAFAEKWRLMCPAYPPIDPYDINDPEGLDFPSVTDSSYRLPSYFRSLSGLRNPAHQSELLVLVALIAGATVVGSPHRPFNETFHWTLGIAGGRWSQQQLIAAEGVFNAFLETVEITEDGAWAIKAEMEKVGELTGKLFT